MPLETTNDQAAPFLHKFLPKQRWLRVIVLAAAPIVGIECIKRGYRVNALAARGEYFYVNDFLQGKTFVFLVILLGNALVFGALIMATLLVRKKLGPILRVLFTLTAALVILLVLLVFAFFSLLGIISLPESVEITRTSNAARILDYDLGFSPLKHWTLRSTNGRWYRVISVEEY